MDLADKLAKALKKTNLPEEAVLFLIEKGSALVEEEKADRRAFAEELERMSDDELRRFVPDVYQKNIFKIDYRKLKERGIRLISFDIDDTINDVLFNNLQARIPGGKLTMPAGARDLFRELKEMGFTVTLLTNAHTKIAQDACEDLQAGGYIARADKPETRNFQRMMEDVPRRQQYAAGRRRRQSGRCHHLPGPAGRGVHESGEVLHEGGGPEDQGPSGAQETPGAGPVAQAPQVQ